MKKQRAELENLQVTSLYRDEWSKKAISETKV